MASSCMMKQLREKHVSAEIKKCVWSPKIDLIAIANVQGQVILYRLSWQQVWCLNPPIDNVKVATLAWRPDSKVLAIGYSFGQVYLVNIEDSSVIHRLDFKKDISSLSWNMYNNLDPENSPSEEKLDPWAPYMYSLPPLSKSFGESVNPVPSDLWQEPRLLQDQTDLNILCVGTEGATLHIFAFGLFHVCSCHVLGEPYEKSNIIHAIPTADLSSFSLVVEQEIDDVFYIDQMLLETPLLALRHDELHCLAQKYGQIHSLMTYAKHTLTLMEEAWESTLVEMDAKLASYATTVPEGGVAADFLDLLVLGHASAEFEIFLTNELTEKSLKKLRHSVDLCYSTMQRLVVRHLQQVGVTLIFLLSQLEGMSKRTDLYDALGVREVDVETSMGHAGSYLLKASEMLQAIDSSMRDFHIFVRWVSGVHLRLLHEPVHPELSRISQHEMANLLNFLNDSFEDTETSADGQKRTHFRLERAGQYLKNENIKIFPSAEQTPFTRLVESNPALAGHKLIFEHNKETSLVQEHDRLFEALTNMGAEPSSVIVKSMQVGTFRRLATNERQGSSVMSQITIGKDGQVATVFVPCIRQPLFYLLLSSKNIFKISPFTLNDSSGSNSNMLGIIDAQFYSEDSLSLLLQDPHDSRSASFAQVSVTVLKGKLENAPKEFDISKLTPVCIDTNTDGVSVRRLEAGSASMMAVSGPRKVTAIIGENRRRVRIYEMEVEEDEDDEDEDMSRNESIIKEDPLPL